MLVVRQIVAFALFAALAAASGLPVSSSLDRTATAWLQSAAPAPDVPAAALAFAGDPEVLIPGLAGAALMLLMLRESSRGRALLRLAAWTAGVSLTAIVLQAVIVHPPPPLALTREIARHGPSLRGPAGLTLGGLAAAGLAYLFLDKRRHPHPWVWLAAGIAAAGLAVVVAMNPVILHFGRQILGMTGLRPVNGFPSAHTARTTFIAGAALRRAPSGAAAIIFAMMASLIYLGVHWTSEALGGFSLGWICLEVAGRARRA